MAWWARNLSRRCTRVIDPAIGSRLCAQSKALSPPPTMTMSRPAYSVKDGTKKTSPRSSQPSPAGSGLAVNLPMPAVMITTLARMTVPSSSSMVTLSSSVLRPVAVRPRRYVGFALAACSTSCSTSSRPFTLGNPATSRIAFSG